MWPSNLRYPRSLRSELDRDDVYNHLLYCSYTAMQSRPQPAWLEQLEATFGTVSNSEKADCEHTIQTYLTSTPQSVKDLRLSQDVVRT